MVYIGDSTANGLHKLERRLAIVIEGEVEYILRSNLGWKTGVIYLCVYGHKSHKLEILQDYTWYVRPLCMNAILAAFKMHFQDINEEVFLERVQFKSSLKIEQVVRNYYNTRMTKH